MCIRDSGNLTRTGGSTSVAGNTTISGNTTSADTTTETGNVTYQSSQVQGGTLLSPPLPKLEEKGEDPLPVLDATDVPGLLVEKEAGRLLLVNDPSLVSE
jgi:hypothetical protein